MMLDTDRQANGIGVPSKYLDLPVLSFGSMATVTLNLAKRVRPHRTKNVRKRESMVVRKPMANAAAAGETPNETRSARESSSWPMSEDFPRHLATLPSKKSKKRPNGIKPRASQRFVVSLASPRQYRIEERMDMTAACKQFNHYAGGTLGLTATKPV